MFVKAEVVDSFLKAISPLPPCLGSFDKVDTIVGLDEMLFRLREIDSSAEIKFGVSKMAILANSLGNVVIKIPFKGTYDYSYYGETDEDDE